MSDPFGLSDKVVAQIHSVLQRHSRVARAVIYGSRAKGNFREGSDIDLTLFGKGISFKELGDIQDELDDLMLPYTFDLSVYENLENRNLRDHIDRVGKAFY